MSEKLYHSNSHISYLYQLLSLCNNTRSYFMNEHAIYTVGLNNLYLAEVNCTEKIILCQRNDNRGLTVNFTCLLLTLPIISTVCVIYTVRTEYSSLQ